MEPRIFLESTGIYHFPLCCYLKESGFEVFVLNPLITNSNRNSGIRKVKNDKNDAIRIAKTGYTHNLKVSLIGCLTLIKNKKPPKALMGLFFLSNLPNISCGMLRDVLLYK